MLETTPWTKATIKKINKEDLENFIFDIETEEGYSISSNHL